MNDNFKDDKGEDNMSKNLTPSIPRYCLITDSLKQSCKEVSLMRQGKLPKKTWNQFKTELKNSKEDEK